MGRVVALCECQVSLMDATDELEPFTPRVCLHCRKPTPPGKWRCADCQPIHGADRDGMIDTIRAARREQSRITHGADA